MSLHVKECVNERAISSNISASRLHRCKCGSLWSLFRLPRTCTCPKVYTTTVQMTSGVQTKTFGFWIFSIGKIDKNLIRQNKSLVKKQHTERTWWWGGVELRGEAGSSSSGRRIGWIKRFVLRGGREAVLKCHRNVPFGYFRQLRRESNAHRQFGW